MLPPKSKPSASLKFARRDYEGIVIDLLDDIVRSEIKAQRLIERLDSISKRPSLRVVNLDMYLWTVAGCTTAVFCLGVGVGFMIWR